MTSEKFGKVFVSTDKVNSDKIVEPEWKEVPFTCFSNSDLIWYGLDGEVNGKFQKYHGHSFSLGFKICPKSEQESSNTFTGKLDTGFCIGEIPMIPKNDQDMEYSLEEIPDNPTLNKITEVDHFDKLASYIRKSVSGGYHGNGKLLYYVLPCVLCDSLKNVELLQSLKLPHKQLSDMTREFTESVMGLDDGTNGNFGKAMASLMSVVTPAMLRNVKLSQLRLLQTNYDLMGKLAKDIRANALEITGQDESKIEPFIKAILNTFQKGGLENCKEFQETEFSPNSEIIQEICYGARGYQIILEAVALEARIYLDENIRETFLFQKFVQHFCRQMGKIQDIFSEKIEPESFQAIMTRLTQEANDNLREMFVISDLLVKLHHSSNKDEDEEENGIISYVRLAKQVICGFVQWQSHRHPKLIFDCYVNSSTCS